MQRLCLILIVFNVGSIAAEALGQQEIAWTADSLRQEGVPQGEVKGPFQWTSKIYPGTVREYGIYVPEQYDPSKPAGLFVMQDGIGSARGWHLPEVLDNLIHRGEIPVQIGVFIAPGVVPAANEQAQPRFNRSFEYDSLGDRYAKFLIEEILPEVKKSYNISDDPNDRAIAGISSGAICAFNVAWERPDQFRRVISAVGTFTGLRGASEFPILIRKGEPRPIRVSLQDGSRDLNIYAGDWWLANQEMLSALKFAGYDVRHHWTDGAHSNVDSAVDLPEAMRFIWRDYPSPVATPVMPATSQKRIDILLPGEGWQLVSSGHAFTEGPAVNRQGDVYFTDIPNNRIHKITADGVTLFAEDTHGANGLMFGPDGKLYACQNGAKKIVRYSPDGTCEDFIDDVNSNDLVLLADGSGYFTDPGNQRVWRFTADGQKSIADMGIAQPNGIIVSPDQTLLTVADTQGRWTWSFQIQPDGSLAYKQPFGWLHLTDAAVRSGSDGMTVDSEGRVYVTTMMGVQVLDQPGRVNVILRPPGPGWLSNVVFGGPELDTLYATCGTSVYKRRLNTKGVFPFEAPVKPPRPGL